MEKIYLIIIAISLLIIVGLAISFIIYIHKQNKMIEEADLVINRIIQGDTNQRLESLKEGKLSRLFHDINSLALILGAHADNEQKSKEFLKNTIEDISHQLKTPISALSIYNEVLSGEDIDEATIKHFNSLSEQEIGRLERLVQLLLKIARLDAMSISMDIKPVRISKLIEDSVNRFSYRAQIEGKALKAEIPDEDTEVCCDSVWMSEALDNLIKNALDHTTDTDVILVSARKLPSGAQINISDTGSGISDEDIYYIFNRFYRSKRASETSGIGLGLSLVKSIVESNGGTVEVESVLGEGSTFHIFLPNAH